MFPRFIRVYFAIIFMVFFSTAAFAGKMELTTYYPAPSGEYETLSSTSNTYLATISGNVGIGTVNPNTTLDVRGQLWIQDANNAAVIHFPSTGTLPGLYLRSSDPSTFAWNPRLYISGSNGNIGIGTEAPTARLSVAGTIKSTTAANEVGTTKNILTTYHSGCTAGASFNTGLEVLCCNSACNRFCRQAHGYSGGTLVEWQGGTEVAACACIP